MQVARVAGLGAAATVGLHHQLVDRAGEGVEGGDVTGAGPVQQAGDADGAVGGQLAAQFAQEVAIVRQPVGAGIKVYLDAAHPIALALPGRQLVGQVLDKGLIPVEPLHPIGEPELLYRQLARRYALPLKTYGLARIERAYLPLMQIEPLSLLQHRLGPDPSPQPELAIVARLDCGIGLGAQQRKHHQ